LTAIEFFQEFVMAEKPRLKVPKEAKKGEVVEIKTLLSHLMETGLRKDAAGNVIPRKIINKFTSEFNGKPVFSADLEPAVADGSAQVDRSDYGRRCQRSKTRRRPQPRRLVPRLSCDGAGRQCGSAGQCRSGPVGDRQCRSRGRVAVQLRQRRPRL